MGSLAMSTCMRFPVALPLLKGLCAGILLYVPLLSYSDVHASLPQDEFKFYMQDAASKLLLVPVRGNKAAESAASSLNIPIATVAVSWTDGAVPSILNLPEQAL